MREFTEQEQVRREKLKNIKNPYPERYEVNTSIKDARNLEDGTTGIRVAGRIVLMRKMGKMSFLTIGDIEGRIQGKTDIELNTEGTKQALKITSETLCAFASILLAETNIDNTNDNVRITTLTA